MRKTALLTTLLIIVLFSACNSNTDSSSKKAKTDIPEPLDESKGDVLSFKRYDRGNLVDAIYLDLVKRTPELQDLENQLDDFNANKADSLAAYYKYKAKVEDYYSSANQNLENIKDTVLKARLKVLLGAGKNRYIKKADGFESMINNINHEEFVMRDYHETLKLVATLPVMEK